MSRHVIVLERTWGTTDEDCRGFVLDLYRKLYGGDDPGGERAGPLAVGPDVQEIVVDAEDYFTARLLVEQAAREVDPTWRRLYRFARFRSAPARAPEDEPSQRRDRG